MKATLIVLAVVVFQFAGGIFVGKCMRAGHGPRCNNLKLPSRPDARPLSQPDYSGLLPSKLAPPPAYRYDIERDQPVVEHKVLVLR
jgi:hypothetical protein